ncbi:adenylate kinase [Roseibium sp. MMSF_3544]|uniref:adenylate kinase n=1 Tax=unclassified Roseibium TaxID=2629323 RepID=UPI00273E23C3|nr:adenylate kinase [Roseibium sp. MMSF_3544]
MASAVMQRVLIAGCPGSGKSTAALRLGELTGLPVVHLDQLYWKPGWVPPEKGVWPDVLRQQCSEPRWIMDGNYGSTLHLRLEFADTVLFLDYPTWICASRMMKRTFWGRVGGSESGRPDGCPERFNWEFFRFILNYRKTKRFRDFEQIREFRGELHVFEHPVELDAFLSGLAAQSQNGL